MQHVRSDGYGTSISSSWRRSRHVSPIGNFQLLNQLDHTKTRRVYSRRKIRPGLYDALEVEGITTWLVAYMTTQNKRSWHRTNSKTFHPYQPLFRKSISVFGVLRSSRLVPFCVLHVATAGITRGVRGPYYGTSLLGQLCTFRGLWEYESDLRATCANIWSLFIRDSCV